MVTLLDPNTALILIDLQKGIVQNQPAAAIADILVQVAKPVKAFRQAALPVVVVNVNQAGAAWTKSRKDATTQASPKKEALEITPEVKSLPGDIFITKHTWGAFFETPLHEALQQRQITGIVLAGVSTSIGVEGTARGASELGYNITFAKDAMTDLVAEAMSVALNIFSPG